MLHAPACQTDVAETQHYAGVTLWQSTPLALVPGARNSSAKCASTVASTQSRRDSPTRAPSALHPTDYPTSPIILTRPSSIVASAFATSVPLSTCHSFCSPAPMSKSAHNASVWDGTPQQSQYTHCHAMEFVSISHPRGIIIV